MNIFMGPVGRVSRGDVLDVNVKAFERTLKAYDSQLYVGWNPDKYRGNGCWEIRRKPDTLRTKSIYDLGPFYYEEAEKLETDIIHHVLDCGFLNYDAMNKLRSMDAWDNKQHWIHDIEYLENKKQEENEAKARKELRYNIKQNQKVFDEFKELVKSGVNPAQVLTSVKWVYKR